MFEAVRAEIAITILLTNDSRERETITVPLSFNLCQCFDL